MHIAYYVVASGTLLYEWHHLCRGNGLNTSLLAQGYYSNHARTLPPRAHTFNLLKGQWQEISWLKFCHNSIIY